MKIGHHLLAVVLFGALATPSSWAEDAASGDHETGAASSPAKASGSHQGSGTDAAGSGANSAIHGPAEIGVGPKGEGSAGPKGEHSAGPKGGVSTGPKSDSRADVKGATVHGTHKESGTGVNPIDTRITVDAARTTKKPDKAGDLKKLVTPSAAGNFRAPHQISAPGAIGGVARNAIGLPVADRARAQGPNVSGQPSPPAAQMSGPSAVGGFAGTGVSGPKSVHQIASPIATATAMNHGTINGTGLARPGSGPGIVGGPAKIIAGINGTGIRPKH